MIEAKELLHPEQTGPSSVGLPTLNHENDWTLGYDDVVRAARTFARGATFLSRHWEELDDDTRGSLLRSIEATAHDVTALLGAGRTTQEQPLLDEALAARVASF